MAQLLPNPQSHLIKILVIEVIVIVIIIVEFRLEDNVNLFHS